MARRELAAAPAAHGAPPRIELLYEDTQFALAATVSAFRKLVHHDRVDAVLVLGSSPAAAIAPIAEREKVLLIAWASAEGVAQGRDWVIRSWISGAEEGAAVAERLLARTPRRIGVISAADEYADSFIQGVTQTLRARSPETTVLSFGQLLPTETELRIPALNIKTKQVDALVLCLSIGQSANLARQLRALKSAVPLFGCELLDNEEEQQAAAGALKGAQYATVAVSESFRTRYTKEWNTRSIIAGAAVHYELYRLLYDLLQTSDQQELTGAQVREALLKVRQRNSELGPFDVLREGGQAAFRFTVRTEVVQ
jgi:ABC-type branched-subunit amino acid transport system substrate-binding protein